MENDIEVIVEWLCYDDATAPHRSIVALARLAGWRTASARVRPA